MEDARGALNRVYLDHAATTSLAPGVLDAMLPYLGGAFGNPSSVHADGRRARAAVDAARDVIAAELRCQQRELVFTGSGTEADNLALRGTLERHGAERGRHIVVSAIEHDAVLETARRLEETGAAALSVVACDERGVVSPEAVAGAVRDDTVAVSVMLVNNECGVVQDVAAIAAAVRARNPRTLVHSDAVQALARMPAHPLELGLDLATFSAHKLGGPKGAGALWVRHGVAIAAQATGGGQERNRRSGTENVAGIVGFAAALRRLAERRDERMRQDERLGSLLVERLPAAVQDARLAGAGAPRVPGLAMFVVRGVRTDVLLTLLDRLGVSASGGSACSSGAPTPSHVLLAMGVAEDEAACALRLSVGEGTTEAEVDFAVRAVAEAAARVRGLSVAASS